MSEPFLGEIKMFGFNFAPKGWAFCDGQELPINNNQSLYSLLGTTYGGNGRTSFALPDLRSRTPIHMGDGVMLGQKGGLETVVLTESELATHSHTAKGTNANGDEFVGSPSKVFATSTDPGDPIYLAPNNLTGMDAGIISHVGGSQAHNNMQPSLVISYGIALSGLFPSRN